jgi:uncharacterized iron-regulated membrane protein
MRQALLVLHRYLALAAALFLTLVAASGCILVFEGAIDRALNARLWHVEASSAATLPLDTLVARVSVVRPGERVSGITPSPVPDRATVLSVARGTQLFVNPYTGAILGTRTAEDRERSFARRAHVFHETLMAKTFGSTVVGLVTAGAFLLVLSGIPLWWRRKIVSVGGGSWKRVVFDLHHSAGVLASLVLAAITFTGAWMHYDGLTRAIRSLDGGASPAIPKQPAVPPNAEAVSIDSAVRVARRTLPGAHVMGVSLPADNKQPVMVSMRFPEDRTPGGRSRVFIDRSSGGLLGSWSTRTAPLGTRLDNLKRSVHTGDIFGKASEVIWLLASLVMIAQAVTGVLMWWNGRAARTAEAKRGTVVAKRERVA